MLLQSDEIEQSQGFQKVDPLIRYDNPILLHAFSCVRVEGCTQSANRTPAERLPRLQPANVTLALNPHFLLDAW